MAIDETVDILTAQLWPQGDIRDPLGTWGWRHLITGDATGGSLKTIAQVAADQKAAYVFTCYAVTFAQIDGDFVPGSAILKARLLSNWPNLDPQAGVQGFATMRAGTTHGAVTFTAPIGGTFAQEEYVTPNERFLLLFDPRPQGTAALALVEQEVSINTLNTAWAFEGWGYYWDRSVLQAPGGPRHPGSS